MRTVDRRERGRLVCFNTPERKKEGCVSRWDVAVRSKVMGDIQEMWR